MCVFKRISLFPFLIDSRGGKKLDTEAFIEEKTKELKKTVAGEKVIVALSGGVDSSVAAVLAHKALGKQLQAVFLDDGLMREKEGEEVKNIFAKLGIEVTVKDVQQSFFDALKGITDPEEKRKAFRDTFYKALGAAVKESQAKFMIQGTIKADVIETKKGIKTQHNVLEQIGVDPSAYQLQILEPLVELFKPDVREVSRTLGLPEELSERMPFPGPGLATRCVGECTPERIEIVRKTHVIVEDEIRKAGLKPFQAFAVLLNDRGTGLDAEGNRNFGNIIVVRSIESENAMTGTATDVPMNVLQKISERIVAGTPSVTRVLYELTGKPPATIEYI